MTAATKKKKIPLPKSFFNETLHRQTGKYWQLSQIWNGTIDDDSMTINGAMRVANNILSDLNPTRPLAIRLECVKQNIVLFGTRKRMLRQIALTPDNVNQQARITVL